MSVLYHEPVVIKEEDAPKVEKIFSLGKRPPSEVRMEVRTILDGMTQVGQVERIRLSDNGLTREQLIKKLSTVRAVIADEVRSNLKWKPNETNRTFRTAILEEDGYTWMWLQRLGG